MSFRWILVAVVGLIVWDARADAQSLDSTSRAYQVRGFYQDDEAMQPWRAALSVADSTLDGAKAMLVRLRSRLVADKWLFDYVAVWTSAGAMRARLAGDGRAGKSHCELAFANGLIEGVSHEGPLTAKPANGTVIPDFALPGYLSTLRLNANDTVRVSVVKCLPHFGAAGLVVVPFVGVVRAIGSESDPAWEIKGGGEHPAEVVIRRKDTVVLSSKTPQGPDAYSLETLIP